MSSKKFSYFITTPPHQPNHTTHNIPLNESLSPPPNLLPPLFPILGRSPPNLGDARAEECHLPPLDRWWGWTPAPQLLLGCGGGRRRLSVAVGAVALAATASVSARSPLPPPTTTPKTPMVSSALLSLILLM